MDTSKILKLLGHDVRLGIVLELSKGDAYVGELQNALDLPQSTVSQHLSLLRNLNIVDTKREGAKVLYSLMDETTRSIVEALKK